MTEQPTPPVLRVLRGSPTPEEVAALVAVLAAASLRGEPPPPPRSLWATPSYATARLPRPGPGAWRASGLPR